jgi:hypothetical protein
MHFMEAKLNLPCFCQKWTIIVDIETKTEFS